MQNVSPAAIGSGAACVLLSVIGLVRAISDYGRDGLVAYLKLLFGPAILVAAAVAAVAFGFRGGLLWGAIPSASQLKMTAVVVLGLGVAGTMCAGVFGVGWLVHR